MREARLPSGATGITARGGGGRAVAATIADDVPIVSAVAVSESRIAAEVIEDRLQDAEQRAAAAEAAQRAAEAARQDQEVRLAQLEWQLAAVLPPPPPPPPQQPPPHDDDDDEFDNEDDNDKENKTQNNDDLANEGNNNSGGNSSPKQLSQRQRYCIVVVVVAVLVAAAAVAGICGTGRCSSPTPSPVPWPVAPPPVPQPAPQPVPQPTPQPVPQPVPQRVTTMPITATARADTILPYINGITLSGRTLTYLSNSSAEERAVQWPVEDDLGTAVDDEPSLRQRYVLGTLWFLNNTTPTTGFGRPDHAATWTTTIDECEWFDVECDGNGRVTALNLGSDNVRGQIPHDLGLLTDLTWLALWSNQLSGTIPSSLGALKALTGLGLGTNQLSGTIPSSLGALTALNLLSLSTNQLSGTIPSSLGTLTALTSLWLYENQLVGTMPFCKISGQSTIDRLVADCAKVNCTCCTHCCTAGFGNIPVDPFRCNS